MTPTFREAHQGVIDIVPSAIAAAPFALLFGALAAAKGLSPLEVLLMGALVFAGGAQFAAIEIWTMPAPVLALVFSTLLINSRHVLMSASIVPRLEGFSTWQKRLGLGYMADENWALAERRARTHALTPAYWFGMIGLLVPTWLSMTTLGAVIGPALGDPRRFGADFAFTAIFIALIASLWKGRVTAWTVAAAGLASALTYRFAGPPWHVLAGALSGLAAAWWAAGASALSDAGGRPLTLDTLNLVAILGMALVTYATRVAGLALAGRMNLSARAQAAFDAIPPAVLVAVIAPSALATGWPETAAAGLAALAATRLPVLAVVAVGVAAVVLLRALA